MVGVRTIWLVLAVMGLFAHVPARAQAGQVGTPVDTCIARARQGQTPAGMFAAPASAFDCDHVATGFGAGDYWVRSGTLAIPATPHEAPRIRFASLWQDRVTLYARYADGRVVRHVLDGHETTRHIQLGAVIEQELPVRAVALTGLLWHVEGATNARGIVVGAAIATAAQSNRSNIMLASLYAAFIGLALALLLYNLALWAALRHRFQLAYCVMLAALSFYAFSSSGALGWLLPDIVNNDRIRLNYLALAISAAAALEFARSFFETRIFAGWLGRLATAVDIALLGAGLLFAMLAQANFLLFDRLFGAAFVALLCTVVPMLVRAWRERSNYLWLFAIAWAAPIALATLRVCNSFHLLPTRFWLDNSTILAMTLEALISGIAIAYRIRLLSQERDDAREKEIAARLLADSDPLTGLMNRRGFLDASRARRGTQQLLIADIDHFKRVNDTLGHDGGDEVLRLVARALRAASPPSALVARFGGEEFVILTDLADAPTPAALLERVRAQRMPFDLGVTISIGSCAGPLVSEQDWKTLYRSADRALFDAKAAGRDRVRHGVAIAA